MGVIYMSKKYSYEMKLNSVQEYLNGSLGTPSLAQKYHVSNCSLIQTWINQYNTYGKKGLKKKKTNNKYPLNFKLDVLRFKQDTGASYRETANAFGIGEPSITANWKRQCLKEGTTGLSKPQGRPLIMPKSNKDKKKQTKDNRTNEQAVNEIELLKKENEYLRIELEYLKKLKALGLKDPRANNKSE